MKTPEEAAHEFARFKAEDFDDSVYGPTQVAMVEGFIAGVKWREENPRPDPFTELLKRKLKEGWFDGERKIPPGPNIGEPLEHQKSSSGEVEK